MKSIVPLFVALPFVALASSALAGNATIQTQMGPIPGLTASGIGILVSDTAGDGFAGVDSPTSSLAGLTISAGEVFGGDDFVIAVLDPIDFGGPIGLGAAGTYVSALLESEQLLAIYWFYDLGDGGTVAGGQAFGMFRTDILDSNFSGATIKFEWPSDGTDGRIAAFANTLAPGSPFTTAQFLANDGVVTAGGGDGDGDGLPDDWETANLGTTAEGALDDNEMDGLTNIEEFLFGSHPAEVTGSSHRPGASLTAGDQILFEARINQDASSVTWVIETSTDGVNWSDATALLTAQAPSDQGDGTEIQGFLFNTAIPEPGTAVRLFRVRIN